MNILRKRRRCHFHFCPVCNDSYNCKKTNCEDVIKKCGIHKPRKSRKRPKGNPNILFFKRAKEFDKKAKIVNRSEIIKRDKGRCYLCGRYPAKSALTLDHVVPLVKGGKHDATNLRVACRSCNSKKGARVS